MSCATSYTFKKGFITMDKLLKKLYKYGTGDLINNSVNKLMKCDKVYQHDLKDLMELEQRYDELNLSQEHRIFIGDYIACMQTVHARANDISYMAGFKDAVSFFHSLNLFKKPKL